MSGQDALRRVVRVHGRVQGVGFRWATAQEAERLGVAGTVRNLLDGTVEADVEGPAAAVGALVDWLGHGPPSARVERTEVTERAPRPAPPSGFRVL
ncbi:acylphosphatase [Brachybacterium sp. NBEC-018]|uniref:acylphosphatase n=1 Tax=Brachybacterium sp. NBEC-018 TaxID=2996004 RepID=UPI0021753A54|nr:acylphosphatase [Brachybacterium sp. NBEC-018]UVY85620.1 acylphosphatase [Brachybacterium sp. NBEC-018]